MRFMNSIIYLILACITLTATQSFATPRRRTVEARRGGSIKKARRRPVNARPAARRKAINQRRRAVTTTPRAARNERRVERRAERRAERRTQRRVERRTQRRVERKATRRATRRANRRHFRRGVVRHRRHSGYGSYRPYVRARRRAIPIYVTAPPRRVVIDTHIECHGRDDDHYFDTIYHDGGRYGINGDLADEERRINRGIERGLITPREARRLQTMLWEIYALEDQCTADGFLTEEEEADLYWAERDLNRAIRWETRDFETWF